MSGLCNRLAVSIACFGLLAILPAIPSYGAESWVTTDKRLKQKIYQINVGLKLRVNNSLWAQVADLAPKSHYPVFVTSRSDPGYRVVGRGSTFPVVTKTSINKKSFFVTNGHVVESGLGIANEAKLFFAGARIYAEQTANGQSVDARYEDVMKAINLVAKKNLGDVERSGYQSTVDGIWECYDKNLSQKADPSRALFHKYESLNPVEVTVGYFLHAPGAVSQRSAEATIYKESKGETEPDLAVLTAPINIVGFELESLLPSEGQEVQVIGYPTASEQIEAADAEPTKVYAPTFNTGRISRVTPHSLQVDAPITAGASGGPVVTLHGKVIGVVSVRAVSPRGGELPNFGGAVTVQSLKAFAPELF